MKFEELVNEALKHVEELFPWDLEEELTEGTDLLLLDVREPYEYQAMHIRGSINVPRGVLESACEYEYEETVPELVEARDRDIVVICRSGKRSALAADVMQKLGYRKVRSLKTGLRGWSDYDQELIGPDGEPVDEDTAIDYFTPKLRPEQLGKT
ncbi:MAG TPA: rhodanese-like domain-containing protein [Gammaproteobacteria bacterium]|nr:rhodanese-like domain-containing protein [Gammaproteobacteria bacterium]